MMVRAFSRTGHTSIVLALLVASCVDPPALPDLPPGPKPPAAAARIRIRNVGNTPIRRLSVVYKTGKIGVDDVAPGETSKYQDARDGVWEMVLFGHVLDGKYIDPFVQDWHGDRTQPFKGNSHTTSFSNQRNPSIFA
jgi:hypothetical protein